MNIKLVLKDNQGKVVNSVEYPEKNALKLLKISKDWELADDTPFTYKNGELIKKTPKKSVNNNETVKDEAAQ